MPPSSRTILPSDDRLLVLDLSRARGHPAISYLSQPLSPRSGSLLTNLQLACRLRSSTDSNGFTSRYQATSTYLTARNLRNANFRISVQPDAPYPLSGHVDTRAPIWALPRHPAEDRALKKRSEVQDSDRLTGR
ncbi:hypothetical protein CDEST_09311 [Colletotrichum destructivum]|uniref:Uncharacterized protein n=1 Tax=Colletotrichum destructivum TaxID=34406 RepID=A0AAX4ILP4_9PEZI|nr:hypothetical protein CDEST_09311 [Colletotrichum destructivum]